MDLTLIFAGLAVASIICQWFSWWVKLPAILFLILTGILAGPVLGWLDPDKTFGDFLFPFVSLSVAIILFEGSLTLNFREIRGLGRVIRRLNLSGALITMSVVTLIGIVVLELSWPISLLLGSLMVVTGPTVVIPMLRTIRPNSNISSILRWEGITIDTVGALLAVVVYEFIVSSIDVDGFVNSLIVFGQMLLIGFSFGVIGGWFLGTAFQRYWIPEYLHNLATLAAVTAIFAISNSLRHESGLLSVTVMGMWLANTKGLSIKEVLNFKESLTLVFISGLFIVLAARIDADDVIQMAGSGLFLFLSVQFLARPLKVAWSTWGSKLTWQERVMIAWIGPRGIVAAAVSALFAFRLGEAGFEGAEQLVPLTFCVIVGTVVFQSATAGYLARLLGVSDPEPSGFLIIGANPVARAVGLALKQAGYRVVVTDGSWDNISAARMDGLETYYGNVVSDHADQNLVLIGLGYMLAITPQRDLNVIATMRYRNEFGANYVYTMQTTQDKKLASKHQASGEHRGNILFGDDITFSRLASLLARDHTIRSTTLTDTFNFDRYLEQHPDALLLFAKDLKSKVHVFQMGTMLTPQPGWTVIALLKSEPKSGLAESKGDEKLPPPDIIDLDV